MKLTREETKQELNKAIKYQDEKIAKFETKFKENQLYALEWSLEMFQAVAKKQVYNTILAWITNRDKADVMSELDGVKSEILRQVIHMAKYPSQSTSPTSNLTKQYELAAWADSLEYFQ